MIVIRPKLATMGTRPDEPRLRNGPKVVTYIKMPTKPTQAAVAVAAKAMGQ